MAIKLRDDFDARMLRVEAKRKLYGARKIWHVLRRDGQDVARCRVKRLMRAFGIRGVVRCHIPVGDMAVF